MGESADVKLAAEIAIVIVGGGPVGLALASELAWHDVPCLLVERRDGSIGHPKMNQVSARTMEFCRRWGIAKKVRAQSIPEDFPRHVKFETSTTGYLLANYEFPARQDAVLTDSPEYMQRCSQLWFDHILRDHTVSSSSVEQRYRTEFLGFVQNNDGVTIETRDLDTGESKTIRAEYLVACDGAESGIRDAAGIKLVGDESMSFNINVFFRSPDHESLFAKGRATMQWLFDENGLWADMVSINGKELWRLSIMRLPLGTGMTLDQAAEYIRKGVGRDFEFEVLSILPWMRRRVVADRFREGRIFLTGDSAHQMSPTGGYGMNAGIAEAVDLGWKVAAVYAGWGGAHLLDSYDAERRPVAQATTDEGARNFNQFLKIPFGPEIDQNTPAGEALRQQISDAIYTQNMDREYDTAGFILGYRYQGSPICVDDGTPEPPFEVTNYMPTSRPGHRAPHAWLGDNVSVLDCFGRGFTLLNFGNSNAVVAHIQEAAKSRGVPLRVHDISDPAAAKLYERDLVLVRPDGHVAWRGDTSPKDPLAIIDRVRGA